MNTERRCPDKGACHHRCGEGACFRVAFCAPLTGAFPNDEWPRKARVLADLHIDSVGLLADPPEHNVVLSVRPVSGHPEPSDDAAARTKQDIFWNEMDDVGRS